ncbi:MAG: phosphodiester glycosidase family protein [Gemmatimonadaceae bacterium]|nr:phosphodiester glycosidase family protein [Gemmatimonadaceae bacterium]
MPHVPRCLVHSLLIPLRLVLLVVTIPPSIAAQSTRAEPARELAPGVSYRHVADARGPWSIHVVRVDLRRAAVDLQAARAGATLRGRERTSAMASRVSTAGARVLAAVNADFFDLKSGENENNQVLAGDWWKGLKVTESPFDTYDNIHAQFAMDAVGHPIIDRFMLEGKAWVRGAMTPIITLNANPSGAPEGTALYTARFGATTPRDTTRQTAEAALVSAGRRGDTLLYVRRGPVVAASGSTIPSDGAVLAAYGARMKEVQAMGDGDTVRVMLATVPRMPSGATPTLIIGGWPRILRDGVNVAGDAATTEGTISRNAEVRHPRTAVGYSRDGRTLWLYVVDGRSTASVGMTLVEMADDLKRLGAWQAMNFDGGGSTTMVIDGTVVNTPSDPTGEREVGNALLIVAKPRGRSR